MEVMEGKKPYAEWEVGGDIYKLKLTTAAVTALEAQYNGNLIQMMDGGIPSLGNMLNVVHRAAKAYKPSLKLNDVYNLFDQYVEEGGSQVEFMTNVFIPVFQVSGFFSRNQAEAMGEKIDGLKEKLL